MESGELGPILGKNQESQVLLYTVFSYYIDIDVGVNVAVLLLMLAVRSSLASTFAILNDLAMKRFRPPIATSIVPQAAHITGIYILFFRMI